MRKHIWRAREFQIILAPWAALMLTAGPALAQSKTGKFAPPPRDIKEYE